MNTDDLRRVLAEHEDLAPGTSGMIDRIRERARRRTRRRRRAATTSAVAAVAAIAVSVPLTLTDPGSGRPVGGPPARSSAGGHPDVQLPVTVADAPDEPTVTGYETGLVETIHLANSIQVELVGPQAPYAVPASSPIRLPDGIGYVAKSDTTFTVWWSYASGKWAVATGPDLDQLVELTGRISDRPTTLRFPFRLDNLADVRPRVIDAFQAVGSNDVLSRLEIQVESCPGPTLIPDGTSSPPAGPPCVSDWTPRPPMCTSAGGGPEGAQDCAIPPGRDPALVVEVRDKLRPSLEVEPISDGTSRIFGPASYGYAMRHDGMYVTVTVPSGLHWPGDREDGIQRILAGLTLLPIDDRSAWTDDPLP